MYMRIALVGAYSCIAGRVCAPPWRVKLVTCGQFGHSKGLRMVAKWVRRVGWGASVALASQLTVGCSSSTPATAMTVSELTQRQLTSKTAPEGYYVDVQSPASDAAADDSASPQPTSIGQAPCDALGAGGSVTSYEPPAAASNVLLSTTGLDGTRWIGAEELASYSGDGAARVLTDLRQLVTRCAKTNIGDVNTPTYATALDGPKLGDESLTIKVRTTSILGGGAVAASDSIIIRIGSTLILVDEVSAYVPPDDSSPQLTALAPAAVKAFNAAGNGN